jgi:hypothetical protein
MTHLAMLEGTASQHIGPRGVVAPEIYEAPHSNAWSASLRDGESVRSKSQRGVCLCAASAQLETRAPKRSAKIVTSVAYKLRTLFA